MAPELWKEGPPAAGDTLKCDEGRYMIKAKAVSAFENVRSWQIPHIHWIQMLTAQHLFNNAHDAAIINQNEILENQRDVKQS